MGMHEHVDVRSESRQEGRPRGQAADGIVGGGWGGGGITWAMMLRARVVLPLDSGPNTSMMRPRGMPPPRMPSTVRQPVEMRSLYGSGEVTW